jgi:D-glycero-alpha-D-manno-heptose-7-phosphate kinase
MVDEGTSLMESSKSFEGLGKMLDAAWKSKRSLDQSVSNCEIDNMYESAIQLGAWGGKVLGAGGGGFLLVMGPDNVIPNIAKNIGYGAIPFEINSHGVMDVLK